MTDILGVSFLSTKIMFLFIVATYGLNIGKRKWSTNVSSWYLKNIKWFLLFLIIPQIYHMQAWSFVFVQSIAMMFLAFAFFKRKKVRDAFLSGYFIGFLVPALMLIMGIGIEYNWEGRVTVMGFNQNLLAINLVLSYFLFTRLFKKPEKLLDVLFSVLIFLAVLKTGSRQGMIAYVILIAFNLYNTLGYLLPTMVAGIASLFVGDALVWDRVISSFSEGDTGSRLIIWNVILDALDTKDYLFGIGGQEIKNITREYFGYSLSAHNAFIEEFARAGIFGLLAAIIFMITVIRAIQLHMPKSNFLFITVICLIFMVGHPYGTRILWFLIPLLIYNKSNDRLRVHY